jgi:hypothetical protein
MHTHAITMPITPPFQPLNLCMGIISAPVDEARDALTRQLDSIRAGMYTSAEERMIDWNAFFVENGLNYNVMKTRMALFKASDNLTIYTSSAADGWWTMYSNTMEKTPFYGYFFSRTLKNGIGYHGFQMKIWKSGVLDRHVRTLKAEDGWEFLSEGNLAPFENAELYKKRRIADRLNQEAIEAYSEAAGFPISSVVEHRGPAVLFYRPTA